MSFHEGQRLRRLSNGADGSFPTRYNQAGKVSLRGLCFLKAELLVELIVRLAINLDVWINEVIQRWTVLLGGQCDIAAGRELHPIRVNAAEEIVFFLLRFPCLRNVDRNPAGFVRIELSQAVVTGDLSLVFVLRQRKTDVEAGGNPVRTQHADKWRVEISTVAVLGIAGPHRIPASPSRAGLVVTHIREEIIVGSLGLRHRPA